MVQPTRNVLIFGITGHQGHSVAKALLQNGSFKIRGLTKSDESNIEIINKLKTDKVDLVTLNIAKDDLTDVFDGIDYVFAMTDYWDAETRHHEVEIGKRIVEHCKKAGVKHIIWSTLPNAREISGGKLDPAMFRDKATVDEFIRNSGIPYTLIQPGFFFQNFITLLRPKDDAYELIMTLDRETVIHAVDANDLGAVVLPILLHPEQYHELTIPVIGEIKKLSEFVVELERMVGSKVNLLKLDRAEFKAMKEIPDAEAVADMFDWIAEFGYLGPNVDTSVCQKLAPGLRPFAEFEEIKNPKLGGFAQKAAVAQDQSVMASVEKAA